MLKNDICEQHADLFNLSFTTGAFPTLLITAKLIPIHKKDSKLNFTNYCPISLLSHLDKILENLIHNRLITFLILKILPTLYSLVFAKITLPCMYALVHLKEALFTNFTYSLLKKHWTRVNMVVGFLLIFKRLLTLLTITVYWVS